MEPQAGFELVAEMDRPTMTNAIREILASGRKHKEQVALIAEKVKGDEKLAAALFELLIHV